MSQLPLFEDEKKEKAAVILALEAQEALIREMAKMILAIQRMERRTNDEGSVGKV